MKLKRLWIIGGIVYLAFAADAACNYRANQAMDGNSDILQCSFEN
ncbi:hypothetical protein [Photobacterium sagamiensis]